MSFHKNTRKEDLINVLKEIGEQATSKETIIELKTKLEKSAAFKDDPDFVINLLNLSVEDRQAKAERQLQETNSQLDNCDENKTVVNTSLKSVQTSHDVNLRITQAFSHIGKGYSAIEKFCMVMNIDPFSSTTYGKCARRLDNAYTLASENIFAEIHREIKNVYENGAEITDLSVSFDGTGLTRGHTSLIGVGCVIDVLTGYVVDFEVMSKEKVYGPDIVIKKEECINHVSKRLGTALRSTVKDCRAQDAKPQHSKCPAGENSWCFYQSAIANGEKPNNHKLNVVTPINEKFLPKILPIYQRLASNELLERCIRCGTQNANEKAVCEYNKGTVRTIVETQKALGVATGGSTKQLATILDCRKQKFRKRRQNASNKLALKLIKKAIHKKELLARGEKE
ncbi:uncharacterized protein TNCV_4903111 [Trichonephila clavipes]|nr:uncharacterized protein TNCV_4903111 [Trichonephila clavipes]